MSINPLEGRTAAFFCYGDEGGDEMDAEGRPKVLSGLSGQCQDLIKKLFQNHAVQIT
jgi:hypothetical protein